MIHVGDCLAILPTLRALAEANLDRVDELARAA
jgi:hypothetical protein